jgi:NAD+-dependent protein deacetylase sirtuin 5
VHGSLFDLECTNFCCGYREEDNFTDPIVPALAIPTEGTQPEPDATDKTGAKAAASLMEAMAQKGLSRPRELDISNADIPIPILGEEELPHCPKCKIGLQRPGVVWFGEPLPGDVLDRIDSFIEREPGIDLMMVIGTSAQVYPAAGYIHIARRKGARVAVVNMDQSGGAVGLTDRDWFFQGDASVIVPEILKSVIGELKDQS